MKSEISSALVTGASGFIGGHLVRKLVASDCRVNALIHERDKGLDCPVNEFRGGVEDPDVLAAAAAGVDAVFHLAAKAHDVRGVKTAEDCLKVNVKGTMNLLEACGPEVKHFVFFSSVKAMAEESPDVLDESHEASPRTPYGEFKLVGERLVAGYGEKHGFMTTSLRLPMVYGPGNKGNIYRMIRAVDRGRFLIVGRGGNRRSIVHVGNVVDAAVAVAGNPKTDGKVYIVTDGRSYSVREIYESIARGLGKTPSHFHVPTDVAKGFALLGDLGGRVLGRRVPFDSDALRKLTSSYAFSSGRLRGDLGFRPRYDLLNSIGETIDWYRRDSWRSRKG